jgi:hypothetical protein
MLIFGLKRQWLKVELMIESYLLSVAFLSLNGGDGNRAGFTGRQVYGDDFIHLPDYLRLYFLLCLERAVVFRTNKVFFLQMP